MAETDSAHPPFKIGYYIVFQPGDTGAAVDGRGENQAPGGLENGEIYRKVGCELVEAGHLWYDTYILATAGRGKGEITLTSAQICIVISIVIYMLGMLAIGFVYTRHSNGVDDFYLGGRKLGPVVTAMSAEASDMSSWLLMGLPGVAYFTGLTDGAWTAIGLSVGTYLNWLVVAKRLRRYTVVAGDSITIPAFFSNRFHEKKRVLMGMSAIIIIIFFIPYTASGFAACGKLFSTILGADYLTAMLVSAAVITLYTTLGGFMAASMTDLIQSIVMTAALLIVVFFGLYLAGGWETVITNASQIPGYLSLDTVANVVTGETKPYGFLSIASMIAWGLGYFGMPHILLRFMAIEDDRKIKLSRRIATTWVVISMAVAILIGVIGFAISEAGIMEVFQSSAAAENTVIRIADLLSRNGVLAALLAGVILAGILACTMSTASSQLLAAASSVSQNLLRDVFGIQLSKRAAMIAARLTVLSIAAVGCFLARNPNSSVFAIVSFAWAGFGGTFGPVMLFSLFWRRANRWGAIAGMFTGGAMVFIWKYLVRPLGGLWNIYELLPSFVVASVVLVVVSLLTAAPEKAVTDDFDKVRHWDAAQG